VGSPSGAHKSGAPNRNTRPGGKRYKGRAKNGSNGLAHGSTHGKDRSYTIGCRGHTGAFSEEDTVRNKKEKKRRSNLDQNATKRKRQPCDQARGALWDTLRKQVCRAKAGTERRRMGKAHWEVRMAPRGRKKAMEGAKPS